jgi:DNA-binding MarR family transcriptional regulator
MSQNTDFDLTDFTPYLLNQAADATSLRFQRYYKSHYGMLRTEWRVLFHLGCYGDMTAKEICDRAGLHKTKVSRAVSALGQKRFLQRHEMAEDRRHERLAITALGKRAFDDLIKEAQRFDSELMSNLSEAEQSALRTALLKLAKI